MEMQAPRRASESKKYTSELALVLVTVFWGATFPLIRDAVQSVPSSQFVFLRFFIATCVFLGIVLASPSARKALRSSLPAGLLLGFIYSPAFLAQTKGLETISASRAAFITGSCVVVIPFLSPLFKAGKPGGLDVVSALTALAGIWLLTNPGGNGVSTGDLWVLLCALSCAVYIQSVSFVQKVREHNVLVLSLGQVIGITLAAILAGGAEFSSLPMEKSAWTGILFCALVATTASLFLQTKFQKHTTPVRAGLIFSLEPIFATVFAWILLGETLSVQGALGGAVILLAVVLPEILKARLLKKSAEAVHP